jgi:hypothetical protein
MAVVISRPIQIPKWNDGKIESGVGKHSIPLPKELEIILEI